ncbi:MAG: hypothetical protein JSR46_11425, partial [Verrucomicrobia bacterium]|nr:hypothetical protein [Verrucomicrobiota bacterium]
MGFMSYQNYDKLPHNPEELYQLYAEQKLGKNTNIKNKTRGNNQELTYTRKYTGGERAARLIQGIALTACTLGFGLLDRRIRNKFVAVGGAVEKKALVSNAIFEQVVKEGKIVVKKDPPPTDTYARAFQAEQKLKEGNIGAAIDMLREETEANPNNAFAWGLLGEAVIQSVTNDNIPFIAQSPYEEHPPTVKEVRNRKLEIAEIYFKKSLELEPKNGFAHSRLGAIEIRKMLSSKSGSDMYKSHRDAAEEHLFSAFQMREELAAGPQYPESFPALHPDSQVMENIVAMDELKNNLEKLVPPPTEKIDRLAGELKESTKRVSTILVEASSKPETVESMSVADLFKTLGFLIPFYFKLDA